MSFDEKNISDTIIFDCKSQHPKCKATCCGIVSFSKDFWEKYQEKIITRPIGIQAFPDGQQVIPITENGYCTFLRIEDYQCNIYEERPEICRKYGDESSLCASCPYLDKNGKERSRQQRRSIQRQIDKDLLQTDKQFKRLKVIA